MGMLALRITLFAFVLALAAVVDAHVNDRGMDYRQYKDTGGIPCCSKEDCHPAEKFLETVEDGREVVRLLIDGVVDHRPPHISRAGPCDRRQGALVRDQARYRQSPRLEAGHAMHHSAPQGLVALPA